MAIPTSELKTKNQELVRLIDEFDQAAVKLQSLEGDYKAADSAVAEKRDAVLKTMTELQAIYSEILGRKPPGPTEIPATPTNQAPPANQIDHLLSPQM